MRRLRDVWPMLVLIAIVAVLFFIGTSIATERTYEVETEYTLPEYRTDTARAIDAYQQMINRLLDTIERNNINTSSQLRQINGKLDRISRQISDIKDRLAQLENKLTPAKKKLDKCHSKGTSSATDMQITSTDINLPGPDPLKDEGVD